MKRATDKLVALQFLAVVLPIAVVLLSQLVVDARRAGTLVIAFAAEIGSDVARAREKMRAKGADAIVLNDVSRAGIGFDSERNAAVFITAERAVEIPEMSKHDVAERILDEVVGLRAGNARSSRETKVGGMGQPE